LPELERELLELRVEKPQPRDGFVVRERLLAILRESNAPVVAVLAPGGYGKTTVLSQFVAEVGAPVAWVTLDEDDSDPGDLIATVGLALEEAGLLRGERPGRVPSDEALTRGVRRLRAAVDDGPRGLLVLDNVDQLSNQGSVDVVGALMAGAGEKLRVMIGSRPNADLPTPLLRSRGSILELNPRDLAMNEDEARELFDTLGLPPDGVQGVMDQTEGWPVGVYLSALAIQAGATSPAMWDVNGNHVYLTEYLRQELMKGVGVELESFLMRSSLLSPLSGELCDHVLEVEGSAGTLRRLETSNLLIVPMDNARRWYRYHNLLRDYLRNALHDRHPELESGLHGRAADWYMSNGFTELAIEHSRMAGDESTFVGLVEQWSRQTYAQGRSKTVTRWMDHLEETQEIAKHPELAATGAITRALDGDAGGAERLARLALDDASGQPRPEADLGPVSLILRSFQAAHGVERALRDAEVAYGKLKHPAGWTPASLSAIALATIATEGLEAADPILSDALWRGNAIIAHPMSTFAKAVRCAVAMGRGDWERGGEFVGDALEEIERNGLTTYATSCLPYILASRLALHDGDVEKAGTLMGAASVLRPRLTVALPIFSVLTLHQKAVAYLELADIAGARRVMREASDILALRPRLGILATEHERLKEQLASMPAGSIGPSSLTKAELRLLPFLATHLSYPEIGERIYVSRHTVKTQAMSIFRKLGVSSRNEAVERAAKVGLIRG
jgi:LuxR family transcriptional regulator, maltose regulon positive regulatory protein